VRCPPYLRTQSAGKTLASMLAAKPHLSRSSLLVGIALLIGVALCTAMWVGQDSQTVEHLGLTLGWPRWIVIGIGAAIVAIPGVRRRLLPIVRRVAMPSAGARGRVAWIVGVLAFIYLVFTAHLQQRDLFPKTHDEQSYLLQMRMLAGGRLWMPQHPLADFFDTFYVLVRPVYASLYFPGASLLFVPTIWFGLPSWVMPAMVAGAIVGLVYRIFAELIDGVAGLLGALAMLSLEYFRVYSILLTSHEPMLLLGLLMTWAWLHWRQRRTWRWALSIGVFAGWGAITRPADALCFAIPIGVAILADLIAPSSGTPDFGELSRVGEGPGEDSRDNQAKKKSTSAARNPHPNPLPEYRERGLKRGLLTVVCILAGAAPFLAFQAVFNLGVTGKLFDTPYAAYLRQDQPNTSFGFHPFDPAARPQSIVPQKQWMYDHFYKPYILRHQPAKVLRWWGCVYAPMAADTALPSRVLLIFIPAGILALRSRRMMAVAAVLPLFVILYVFNTYFLEHYAILIAPAVLLLVLLGMRSTASLGGQKWAPPIRAALAGGFAAICILTLPELNAVWGKSYAESYRRSDETFPDAPVMQMVRERLPYAQEVQGARTIVLVKWAAERGTFWNVQEEPVYNTQAAWPDDEPIIFAHDLGEQRNQELYRYYAKHQPDRQVIFLDRTAQSPEGLITQPRPVTQLAH
jgi:hypothetical protein